jgi:exodeoxyribonuclease VII small subunit
MAQKPDKNTKSLESAMERISEIVAAMEEGSLPLEKLLDCYEEGLGLVKSCQEQLDAAEQRIQLIARDARGNPSLKPFDDEEE